MRTFSLTVKRLHFGQRAHEKTGHMRMHIPKKSAMAN